MNAAARQADLVIFISEYAKSATIEYGYNNKPMILNHKVVKHWVDPEVFYPSGNKEKKFTLCASATNWFRKEKMLESILDLVKELKNINLFLIGDVDSDYSPS